VRLCVLFEGAWHAARVRSAVDQLADFANPCYAEAMARYFQVKPGGYGEGDVFLGIRLSELRRLAKPYAKLVYRSSDWLPLLTSAVHEHRQLALLIMAARSVRGTRPSRPRSTATIWPQSLAHQCHSEREIGPYVSLGEPHNALIQHIR